MRREKENKNGEQTARKRKPGFDPDIGKNTRFKAGNPGGGRPRTAKFAEAARQIAAEIGTKGLTGAQRLAEYCFQRGLKGSARHAEMFLGYAEGRPTYAVELSGPDGGAMKFENMGEAEIDARLKELLEKYQGGKG